MLPFQLASRVSVTTAAVAVAAGLALAGVGASAESLAGLQAASHELTRVTEGVYAFRWNAHNALIVVAPEGVVVVDPISEPAARQIAVQIRDIAPGATLRAIVYSHDHADHASGAAALREALASDAPVLAQEAAAPKIRERADPALPPPDITYADRLTLASTERSVELHFLGKSHSDNMSVVLVPEARVAFAVDFIANDRVGYQELPDYHFPDFFETLPRVLDLEFDTIVFGHGPPGDRATVTGQIAYYSDLERAVEQAVEDGLSEDQAAARVELPQYAGWGQYEAWFPGNVRAIHRWVSNR